MKTEKLESMVNLMTPSTDLYSEEIKEYADIVSRNKAEHTKLKSELSELEVVEEPHAPDPDEVKDVAQGVFGLTVIAVVALFLFHCIIWVLKLIFDISWNTWGWTVTTLKWGIGVSLVITVFTYFVHRSNVKSYKKKCVLRQRYINRKSMLQNDINRAYNEAHKYEQRIEKLSRDRWDVLEYALRTKVIIPFPQKGVDNDNYKQIKTKYFEFVDLQNKMKNETDALKKAQLRKELIDKKLLFVYHQSLCKEVSMDIYNEFNAQINKGDSNVMVLRKTTMQDSGRGANCIKELGHYKSLLDDNTMTPILEKIEDVRNQDTSTFLFFTDTEKKIEQTKELSQLAQAAKKEYDELNYLNSKISYALGFVRACAYRNIYLAVEMLNYIRDCAGGGKLTTERSTGELACISNSNLSFDAAGIDTDVSVDFSGFGNMVETAINDKETMKFIVNNPKIAAGAVAVTAIFELGNSVLKHLNKVNEISEQQEKIIRAIGEISSGYTEGQAILLRQLEIIKAIVKANNGFMAIYEPLKEKVFDNNDMKSLTMQDIQQLALATNEFQKISKAKL